MPEQDRYLDLERLVGDYEPHSHEDMLWWVKNRRFADPKYLYMPTVDPAPWQGDVVPNLVLHVTNATGGAARLSGPAMLLSHGCDAVPENDPVAVAAPVFEVDAFLERDPDRAAKVGALLSNTLSRILYLPAVGDLPDRYVDFGYACAVSTIHVQEAFCSAVLAQRTRLSARGWYLFTGKLAHHWARLENPADYPRSLT